MKVLITGASGFIGRHLTRALIRNHEVFAVARSPVQVATNEMVKIIEADLSRPLDTKTWPARVDAVIHLAQANVSFPEAAGELFAVNTGATQQLLDYARRAGARQFILASTGDVYGRVSGRAREGAAARPASYYGATKLAAELLARSYSAYLSPCVLRLYQPYGPGQTNRLIPRLADSVRRREAIRLNKDDRPRLSPIYISDVARAFERVLESHYSGVLNIAGDRAVSMRDLGEEIGRALGIEPVYEETGAESADLMGDNNLMKRSLGSWEMVDLSDGLSRMFVDKEATQWQVPG
jgi:UDP-glucose 4-epimerase